MANNYNLRAVINNLLTRDGNCRRLEKFLPNSAISPNNRNEREGEKRSRLVPFYPHTCLVTNDTSTSSKIIRSNYWIRKRELNVPFCLNKTYVSASLEVKKVKHLSSVIGSDLITVIVALPVCFSKTDSDAGKKSSKTPE